MTYPVYPLRSPDLSAYDNRVMREIEVRAEDEIVNSKRVFEEWVCEHRDTADLTRLLSYAVAGDEDSKGALSIFVDRVKKDYTDYRVAQALLEGEWEQIAQQLFETDRDDARENT